MCQNLDSDAGCAPHPVDMVLKALQTPESHTVVFAQLRAFLCDYAVLCGAANPVSMAPSDVDSGLGTHVNICIF